jgi:hypothetical protein
VPDPNRALFESVVRLLGPVLDDLVFVGGCTTGLFVTDSVAGGIRSTKDVDAIVDVTSYAEYTSLAERLRALGLAEDSTPGAPLCRWRREALIVDVMPIDASVLGFSNRWYPAAIETAQFWRIAGHDVRIVTPALFIATKLEAFRGRGRGDIFASHDLEDIVTVVDGRPEIVAEVGGADAEVRAYVGSATQGGCSHSHRERARSGKHRLVETPHTTRLTTRTASEGAEATARDSGLGGASARRQ